MEYLWCGRVAEVRYPFFFLNICQDFFAVSTHNFFLCMFKFEKILCFEEWKITDVTFIFFFFQNLLAYFCASCSHAVIVLCLSLLCTLKLIQPLTLSDTFIEKPVLSLQKYVSFLCYSFFVCLFTCFLNYRNLSGADYFRQIFHQFQKKKKKKKKVIPFII